jgi:hypothetical protein
MTWAAVGPTGPIGPDWATGASRAARTDGRNRADWTASHFQGRMAVHGGLRNRRFSL